MDDSTIIRFLQGDLNMEEHNLFINWLDSCSANMDLFISVKKVWALTAVLPAEDELNPELEHKVFAYRNFTPSKSSAGSRFNRFVPFLKMAGIVVLTFGLSFFSYYEIFKNSKLHRSVFTEIITRAGEKSQIALSDGSRIWLNASSKIKYPNDLNQKELEFFLDGEAYFDIEKMSDRKIIVHTSEINIKVLGTSFNLKSYIDDDIIETTLVRGNIEIEELSGKSVNKNHIMLEPNQSATFFKNSKKLVLNRLVEAKVEKAENREDIEQIAIKKQANLVVINKVNPEIPISWKDGKLSFKGETFETLAKKMERWYNKKIEIKDAGLKNVRFSGTFDKESIEQALGALSFPVRFSYHITKDSVLIHQ